ncbi:MAG TPA: NAD(P)/FAD-dependent oxidoreductase [Deltaproteobacteria bacterium]|nr:NAD(P)/FAD-dependent oxidoreductase [Deltaproteobacteria bacterium]
MAKGRKRIVVAGAGIGGAAVAALLQHQGNQVTLLERNSYIGGKCTSFEKDGFVSDYAFHIFSRGEKGPLGDVNRRIDGDLRWRTTHPAGRWYFSGGGWFTVPDNAFWAIPYGASAYVRGVIRPGIFNTLRKSLKNYGVMGMVDTAFKLAQTDETFLQGIDNISLQEFLYQFTDDGPTHRFMAIFSYLATVVHYSEASAGELLYCLITQMRAGSLSYPIGGAREIAGSYTRAFVRDGGTIRRGCKVKRILVKDGKARGVETEEGEEIPADAVVSNAGIKSTMDLVGHEQLPAEYVSYVNGLKYSLAANIVRYGMDCRLPEIPRHFFQYVEKDDEGLVGCFLKDRSIPKDKSFAVIKPADWDPYLAPLGKEILLMGVAGPSTVNPENIEYNDRLMDCAERQMFDFFPRIKDHIQWTQRAGIQQTSALTGRPSGECVGLAQCVGQTGAKKPTVKTPIKDLWLVGSDAGARGIGTEQAAASALYVSYLLGDRS